MKNQYVISETGLSLCIHLNSKVEWGYPSLNVFLHTSFPFIFFVKTFKPANHVLKMNSNQICNAGKKLAHYPQKKYTRGTHAVRYWSKKRIAWIKVKEMSVSTEWSQLLTSSLLAGCRGYCLSTPPSAGLRQYSRFRLAILL